MTTARSIKPQVKTAMVPIDQLKIENYARVKLNDDRIMHFAILFENNDETIPAIWITPEYSVIAGRHRIEGAVMAGKKEIFAEFREVSSVAELLSLALLENVGGSLPPTKQDIILVAKEMLESGATQKYVTETISKIYPVEVAKKYVQEARHGIHRDKIARAKREVQSSELTMKAAAEKYDIDLDKLVEEMGGKQPRKAGKVTAADIKRDLSTQFRSSGKKVGNLLDKAMTAYENGDISAPNVLDIIEYQESYVSGLMRRLQEKRTRFENRSKK